MAISVDVIISGKTETSVEGKTSTAVVTTNLQEDKLATKGGIISGSILPHQTDTVDLGSPSKRFLNLYAKSAHLAADSLHLGDEAKISASAGGGFSFDTAGETVFGDIKVRNLTVTGAQSIISSTDLAVKDNIIIINSGEAGAGITLTSGGLVIDRGTLENATILFNDNTDRFELNFPISVDGSELALAPNLVITGQTLQAQITTNDSDIATLTTNLVSTGATVAANLITTGNFVESKVDTLSGQAVLQSMTGNFATHIKDLDDVTLAGNQGKFLKVNSAGDGITYDIPAGGGGNVTGAVKFTGLIDAPNDYSSLLTEFPANGGLVAVNSTSESLVYLNSGTFATDPDLVATGNTLDSQRDTLSGNLISTGNSLQAQITSNDSDIASINTNIISTGNNLENQIIGNDADITTLSGNLITTGTTLTNAIITTGNHLDSLRNTLSGNLISSGNTLDNKRDTLSGNLITTGTTLTNTIISTGNHLDSLRNSLSGDLISSGNTLDEKRDILSGNLITTGQNLQDDIDTVSGNLITTGNNLQSQITSNDSDISTLQTATGNLQDAKFNKTGGIISGEILPNASGSINLGSPSLPFRSGYFNDLIVSSDSIKIGEEATLSSPAAGGLNFDTTGTITFGDVSIKNLTVTGTRTIVESTDTALKDNIIILNSGEDGAGISLTSGGIVIDRGSATDANILFNDSTDQFEVNFPLSVEGSLAVKQSQTGIFAEAANLVTTGQTLQTQITSNDGDITSLTSNLTSTGSTLDSKVTTLTTNLASTGSTLAADIVTVSGLTEGNDNDIATITSNLVTTGQTLTSEINTVSGLVISNDSDISTLTSNLVTTGQTLTTNVNTVATNLGNTGQTLQTQITSNDSDISTLTSNLGTTGQTLQTQITSNDSDISTLTSNLATTGQTLQTQITNNDSDISTLTSNIASTGSTLDAKINTLSGVVTLDSETGNLVDTSMTGNFAVNFLDLDDTPSDLGAVGQSVVVNAARDGLIFSGVSAGGGGGSSTFVGLSDTPGALTASRLLAVNSAGNSIEFLESGTLVTDAETGVFATSANLVTTGQTLTTNINSVSSNLVSTGSVVDDVSGNLITTGQTLQTQITSNDSDISTLTTNLGTTGQTLQTQITSNDSDISTLQNLTGDYLTEESLSGTYSTQFDITVQSIGGGNRYLLSEVTDGSAFTTSQVDRLVINLQRGNTYKFRSSSSASSHPFIIVSGGVGGNYNDEYTSGVTNSRAAGVGQSLIFRVPQNAPATLGYQCGLHANMGSTINIYDETGQFALNSNLISTGVVVDDISGNLITTGQTLQTQITSNDSDISTLTSNLITTGQTLTDEIAIVSGIATGGSEQDFRELSGNLITTGQTLNSEIGIVSGLTVTNLNNLVSTGKVIDDVSGNLITTGQTLQTQITTLQGQTGDYLTEESVSGTYSTQFNVSVANDGGGNRYYLSDVTGASHTATSQVKQLEIYLNRGETYKFTTNSSTNNHPFFFATQGNGGNYTYEYTSGVTNSRAQNGGILYFRVPQSAPDILYYNCGHHAGMGAAAKIYDNTGILASSSDVTSITNNLIATGQTLTSEIAIVSGLTTSNDSDISTLTSNLSSTGDTLSSKIDTLSGVVTLDSETGSLVDTSMTGNFAVNFLDLDDTPGALGVAGQSVVVNANRDGLIFSGVSGGGGGGISTFVELSDTPGSLTASRLLAVNSAGNAIEFLESGTLVTEAETGSLIDTSMTGDFADTTILESFTQGLNIGTSNNLASRKLHVVGDVEISGTIFQSGSVFEGGGGGGGGSSTFVGLSDTPGSFTASKFVRVNPAGNALVFVDGGTGDGVAFSQIHTGDGTTTNFAIPSAVDNVKDVLVSVEGLVQIPTTDYTLAGTTGISFTTGVTSGHLIDIRHLALGPSGAAGADGSGGDLTASGFITTGNTGQFASDADVSSVSSNLVSTGSIVDDISGNLITTGQTLTTNINTVSTNLITTGQTLQTQITSNDGDITTLTSNLITTGQTLQTQITSNDSDITTLTSNLITTGQTLTSEISTLSGLATLDSETGSLIDTSMTGDFADTTILESFTQGLNVGTSNNLASRKLHVVGDVEISGTIYQSGSVFEGGGGGGGGGSSTFVGLSDTPGSFTANKVLTVNSAGSAVETTFDTSTLSGHQSVEQGYFTGLTLGGTGTGILQNASGTISNLDLADNKFDVSVIEERDSAVGDSNFDKVELLLPFDGANDATSTTDESDSNHTVSFNGSADISTAQSKFGGSSLYLPGGNNDYVTIAGSSDFNFGTGDFTIEMWVYRTHTAYGYIFETRGGQDTTSTDGISLYLGSGGNNELRVAVNRSNVININQDHQTNDQWQHFAVVREGSTMTLYIDGTARGSGSNSTDFDRNRPFRIGNIHNASLNGGYGFQGYIDDFRVTKGLARYTSNFTPTSAAHPTSAGITENKYIGQIGGIDDTDVDYGIEKLSNSQLMIKKLSDNTFTPDRLYVNVNKLGALGHGIAFDQVYTGDGTTTNYLLSENVSNARDVLVSVEGLIQTPIIDYTLAGTTGVSFTTGVVSGHEISFRHLALGPSGAAGASADISYLTERFTGNGVVSGFGMSRSISTADEIFVFVNGLVQDSGANFSVTNGTGLFFTSGEIVSGDKIMVRHIY